MPTRRLLTLLALLGSTSAIAEPRLDPMFSDNAVLQRGGPIRISGSAAPRERLTVRLGIEARTVSAGKDGRWTAAFPERASGNALTLAVSGANGSSAVAHNIAVGDVWLCSGQSNMELPVTRALNAESEIASSADADLRLMIIAKKTALSPLKTFATAPTWSAAAPNTVAPFSAACFFMGRDLRKSENVPIGLIDSSWGGTAIRSWMDPAAAASLGGADVALLQLFQRDPAAANRQFGERWQRWWSDRQPTSPWSDPDALSWRPMKASYWETWGDPAFAKFDGDVWARARVTLTAAQAAQRASLSLGVIDEIDQTWVNGVPIGNSFGWDAKRSYTLPAGTLHAGDNIVLVNIMDSSGFGGFQGPANVLSIDFADGSRAPLAPSLEYSVAPKGIGDPPRPPWDSAAGLSLIYNGMIAPLGALPLKGIAWYQGESDGGMAKGYASRLSAMIGGWRRQFQSGDVPFLIVTLANWGPPPAKPGPSGWAEIRDAQRSVAGSVRNAALVPALELGDRLELHPANKQEVGHRLARAARAIASATPANASGPHIVAARQANGVVQLQFAGVTGGLHGWSGSPIGFELCGAAQESCRYVEARAEGSSVVLKGDGQLATRVRYAWADAPVVNLYDEAPLPVSSFEVSITR